MNTTDLACTPATELIPRIRSRALSPVELTRAVLERIERVNPKINAFCTVTADAALAASIFHFGIHTIAEAKAYMRDRGVEVRLQP